MKEIVFSGGVAGATSFRGPGDNWKPDWAFVPHSAVDHGWHVGRKNPSPETQCHGTPVMIWYDFKAEGFRPSEVRAIEIKAG